MPLARRRDASGAWRARMPLARRRDAYLARRRDAWWREGVMAAVMAAK